MHVLSDNLITTLNSLIELEEEISDELCSSMEKKECCLSMECANCILLGNYYYSPEEYPFQVIKTHQSLKGSSNEP